MEEDFFKKYNLETNFVSADTLEVGKSYPIYGIVTQFLSDTPGNVIVEVNYNIVVSLFLEDVEKINIIKERAFEPGIFMITVKEVDMTTEDKHYIRGTCSTVVFGKKQTQYCA